ncbi:hypothetical protein C8J57DRAFT_1718314 [Mycena rebaudengoi]|nr:hypothetical protein C8J57DRAFT_1718314 [Mycena rebaudengoi]
MSAILPTPSFRDLSASLGVIESGTLLGVFLFGIETLQTFHYYRNFSQDSKLLKAAVGLVWVLELGHTISAWHALYSQTITFYGQPDHILIPPVSEETMVIFAALVYTVVQTFFANRVRVLSGQWYIMAFACVLGLLRLVGHLGIVGLLLHYSHVSILLQWRWLVTTALSLDLSVDLLTTASLCHCLWNMRSCESKRTRTIVDTLILWAVESTILTSAASIMQIILFMTRDDLVFVGVFIIQAKLFANAMLASLNGRKRFRNCTKIDVVSDITFGPSHRKPDTSTITFVDLRGQRCLDAEKNEMKGWSSEQA